MPFNSSFIVPATVKPAISKSVCCRLRTKSMKKK